MCRFYIAVCGLLLASGSMAQEGKIPVSVSRTGEDRIGSLFVAALNRELSNSIRYQPMPSEGIDKGLRFYVELATVRLGDTEQGRNKKSAVSVVVEDMGLPSSFPVATKWYHKVVVVDETTTVTVVKQLLKDMDARWCNYIRSSVGGCPKEILYPTMVSQH
jgi:hypothetical protein